MPSLGLGISGQPPSQQCKDKHLISPVPPPQAPPPPPLLPFPKALMTNGMVMKLPVCKRARQCQRPYTSVALGRALTENGCDGVTLVGEAGLVILGHSVWCP